MLVSDFGVCGDGIFYSPFLGWLFCDCSLWLCLFLSHLLEDEVVASRGGGHFGGLVVYVGEPGERRGCDMIRRCGVQVGWSVLYGTT